MGSTSIFAAEANTSSPQRQALISMTATFWDTVVMCAITGIVIVTNILKSPTSIVGYSAAGMTSAAFQAIPFFGEPILAISLIGFAIATLIGWSYPGEQATMYLFGKSAVPCFHLVYITMIFIGAILSLEIVWECTDFFNALLVIPNLYALFHLQKLIRVDRP